MSRLGRRARRAGEEGKAVGRTRKDEPGRAKPRRQASGRTRPEQAPADPRYGDLLEFVPLGLFVLSSTGRIREANLRGARLLGLSPQTVRGRAFLDHVARDCRDSWARLISQARKAGARRRIETELLDGCGSAFHASLDCSPRRSGRRGEIFVAVSDLTDRIASERRSDRLGAAVEQAADAIAILAPEGRIGYVNRAFETANDAVRAGLLGRPYFRTLAPVTEAPGWPEDARSAMARGAAWSGRVKRRDGRGRPRDLELMISPIRDGMKRLISFLVIEHDVTRVSELEENLRRIQKSEAVGTIAGGIAHDLNNILGPIIINTELAQLQVDEDSRALLDGVLKAAFRARALVQQITAFSSPRGGTRTPVRLSEIIRDAAVLLRASIPSTIEIRDTTGRVPGVVEADPTQIHQVLVNLVNNAAQAMQDQGGVLTMDLERVEIGPEAGPGQAALRPGPYLRLSVGDTGMGIEPGHIDRIFDPFFTTKPAGKGMGLGLSVVRGIVIGHGGTVTVRSAPGEGSTFSVYLPEVPEPVLTGSQTDEPPSRGAGRILLVDDEEMHLRSVKTGLEKFGYDVAATTDPDAALESLRRSPAAFDLLFTDQTMPRRTGVSLAQEALGIRPDLPIILCTGLSDAVDPGTVRGTGVRLILRKPLNLAEMARAVASVLSPGPAASD